MSRFELIEKLYFEALSRPDDARLEFLRLNCGDDKDLLKEVLSLLRLEQMAGDFIESPPVAVAASLIASEPVRDLVGTVLGQYRIESHIGSGGMGDVYLATDTTLGRKVALKILPSRFSSDPERRRRFEREARAASTLNHPNIITVHDFGSEDGLDFLATEFIEGVTLRERLIDGPIPPDEVCDIAIQVLAAIEAAHEKGILHRDIKPANIMIRRDGIVKMLDFGLAKITAGFEDFESLDAQSRFGAMGTVHYMSPEQALGRALDGRTDIFSLGVTIYEMLAGRLPFAGATEAGVYDAILHEAAVPLTQAAPSVPAEWQNLIDRALAKDPSMRYENVSEFRDDLQRVRAGEPVVAVAENVELRRFGSAVGRLLAGAAAITIVAGIGYAAFRLFNRPQPLDPQALSYSQLTNQAGQEFFPSLAPDGDAIVYTARDGGDFDIFYRRLAGDDAPVNLTADCDAADRHPAFSPDGRLIAFRSERDGGGIFLMDADGRNVRQITADGFYPSWSPDGREIVVSGGDFVNPAERFTNSFLFAVDVATGNRRDVLRTEDSIQASWSPHGHRIAYWYYGPGGVRDIRTVAADGSGEVVRVTDDQALDWNPVWSPDGAFLYFASNRGGDMNLWRVAIDEESGRTLAEPEAVSTPSSYFEHLTFSRDGRTFAFADGNYSSNLERVDFDPVDKMMTAGPFPITRGQNVLRNPAVSPDGHWIAFDRLVDQQEDIFVSRRDGTEMRQLTNDGFKDRAPRWTPDGKSLVFYSARSGKYEGWQINADGSDLRQLTFTDKEQQLLMWSTDGKLLLSNVDGGYPDIYSRSEDDRLTKFKTVKPLRDKDAWVMAMSWTKDASRLAASRYSFYVDSTGILVYDLLNDRYDELSDTGIDPFWLADDRRLIYSDQGRLFLLDTVTRKKSEVISVAPDDIQLFAVSPDDRAIYMTVKRNEADIWLATAK